MLLHLQRKPARIVLNLQRTSRKSVPHCRRESLVVADLSNRLDSGSNINTIVSKNRSSRADLGGTSWGIGIGSEMIVEPPGADRLAERQHFGAVPRVGDLGHHAVEWRQVMAYNTPFPLLRADTNDTAVTFC